MKWLFKRFLYDIKKIYENVKPYNKEMEELCEKYGKLAEIHVKNNCDYGSVYFNEEFAEDIASGYFTDYDGVGYYVGANLIETEESVDFDEDIIRSKSDKYPYVFWYNK